MTSQSGCPSYKCLPPTPPPQHPPPQPSQQSGDMSQVFGKWSLHSHGCIAHADSAEPLKETNSFVFTWWALLFKQKALVSWRYLKWTIGRNSLLHPRAAPPDVGSVELVWSISRLRLQGLQAAHTLPPPTAANATSQFHSAQRRPLLGHSPCWKRLLGTRL